MAKTRPEGKIQKAANKKEQELSIVSEFPQLAFFEFLSYLRPHSKSPSPFRFRPKLAASPFRFSSLISHISSLTPHFSSFVGLPNLGGLDVQGGKITLAVTAGIDALEIAQVEDFTGALGRVAHDDRFA
jgi:hypothetical protein